MGKKRGNGEGSVFYRKDRKRWVAQVQIGETESGRAKRKTFYGKTQAEVLEKKRQFERELDTSPGVKGPVTEPTTEGLTHANTSQVSRGLTVNQLFDMWLDSLDCAFKTLENYRSIANNHIRPSLGDRQVSEVTSLLIQELYNKKREEGYSPRTIEYIHRTLYSALKQATNWDVIGSNPADAVIKPKGKRTSKPRILTDKESNYLLDVAKSDWYYPVYVTALETGMRMGELFGLHWAEVRLDKGTITVCRAMKRVEGGMEIGGPKSEDGYRTIAITRKLVTLLDAHQEKQKERFGNVKLVFTNRSGTMICPSHFRRDSWYPLLRKAGFEGLRFHDLRHIHATMLLMNGVPIKVVQNRLGHSSVEITLDLYGHVLPGAEERVLDALGQIFDPE